MKKQYATKELEDLDKLIQSNYKTIGSKVMQLNRSSKDNFTVDFERDTDPGGTITGIRLIVAAGTLDGFALIDDDI